MNPDSPASVDLAAYFERIAYAGDTIPSAETLRALHLAHATHIPFENIDVLLGRTIRLDLLGLQAKLVRDRRGGYCFEQNALFAAVLEQLGFMVTRLLARVRVGGGVVLPRTHMVLKVEADDQPWLCDVGFGGTGMLEPVPLVEGGESRQGTWTFRLEREEDEWLLRCPECPGGADQYLFTLEPQLPVDYEPANHYCSTYPQSRFVLTLTAQLGSLHRRVMLRNRELITIDADGPRSEILPSEAVLLEVLAGEFGLRFPAGTSFRPTRDAPV